MYMGAAALALVRAARWEWKNRETLRDVEITDTFKIYMIPKVHSQKSLCSSIPTVPPSQVLLHLLDR